MQDVEKSLKPLQEGIIKESGLEVLHNNLKSEEKPTTAKLNPAIIVPVPLKRKRLSDELIEALNDTYERPSICRD